MFIHPARYAIYHIVLYTYTIPSTDQYCVLPKWKWKAKSIKKANKSKSSEKNIVATNLGIYIYIYIYNTDGICTYICMYIVCLYSSLYSDFTYRYAIVTQLNELSNSRNSQLKVQSWWLSMLRNLYIDKTHI